MSDYIYQPKGLLESFTEGLEELRRQGYKVVTDAPGGSLQLLFDSCEKNGLKIVEYNIDPSDYERYFANAGYAKRYPKYYPSNIKEKSFEHYIAFKLLNLRREDIVIDVASENSPIAEIYHRLSGITCFRQDIMFPEGIHGDRIGGNACAMPVPDHFATKIVLTCSLEHFEEDADTRLFEEMCRVLKPGGMVAVVPFYFSTYAFTLTDPTYSAAHNVKFDRENPVYCRKGWRNRHGRFYSPKSFVERMMDPLKNKMDFNFYWLKNAKEVDASVYANFAFTATLKA